MSSRKIETDSNPKFLTLAERGPLYALASRLLVAEVDAVLWSELAMPPLSSLLAQMDDALGTAFADDFTAEREEELAVEFARLFLLPGGVAPYASEWLAQEDQRAASREEIMMLVREVLTALEIEPNPEGPGGRLPLDHVGLLFEVAARAASETDEATQTIAGPLEEQLFGRAWQGFGRALEREAREPLYRALGRLIADIHA